MKDDVDDAEETEDASEKTDAPSESELPEECENWDSPGERGAVKVFPSGEIIGLGSCWMG